MRDQGFQKVGRSENCLYGPRKILLCGYTKKELNQFRKILDDEGLANIPLTAANHKSLSLQLKTLFSQRGKSDYPADSQIPRAGIMSGITEKELHRIMSAFRDSGLPRQFWAALTPISENWKLSDLLEELKKENEALRERRRKRQES